MLAQPAAGSVLGIGDTVHRLNVFFLVRKVLSLPWSGCDLLLGASLCSGSNRPDEAQQFTSNCSSDLPLVLAGCTQFSIALVQPMLCLPRNFLHLFGNALLSSAQSVPDTGWTTIAPCSFDDDSSQMRVAGFGDASAPGSLTTGILTGYSAAITHQLPGTLKAGYLAQFGCNGHSREYLRYRAAPADR